MKHRFVVFLTLIILAGCAAKPPAGDEELVFSSPEAALNYHLTMGDIALGQRDYPAATDAWLLAMALSEDPDVAQQATRLALHTLRYGDAARAAVRWRALADPEDGRPVEAQVVAALRASDITVAWARMQELLRIWQAPDEEAFRATGRMLLDEENRVLVQDLLHRAARRYDTAPAWQVAALGALRNDDVAAATEAVRRARTLDPTGARAAMLEARILMQTGDAERGIALMRALVEEYPQDPTYRFTLGGLYLNLQRYEEARIELERTVEQAPAYLDARWTLAMLLMQLRNADAAEVQLRALLADPVRRWEAPYFLGGVNELREDWSAALQWFDEVEWGEQMVNARIKSAQMLFNLGRIEEGRERLAVLRAEQPGERLRLLRIEAELLNRAGQHVEALAVFDVAVAEFTDDVGLLYTRALQKERLGEYAAAIADLRRVNEMVPDNAEAQNALGYVLADRGTEADWPEAKRLIARALEQEPDNAAFQDSMGWVLYRLGQLDEAREWLERAWENMKDAEVGAHLGEVLWIIGERVLARDIWEQAREIEAEHHVLRETLERFLDD